MALLKVCSKDIDSLPDKFMDKVKQRILDYQEHCLRQVQKTAKELLERKEELRKRLGLTHEIECLEKEIKPKTTEELIKKKEALEKEINGSTC